MFLFFSPANGSKKTQWFLNLLHCKSLYIFVGAKKDINTSGENTNTNNKTNPNINISRTALGMYRAGLESWETFWFPQLTHVCWVLGPGILPYLPALMDKLLLVLSSSSVSCRRSFHPWKLEKIPVNEQITILYYFFVERPDKGACYQCYRSSRYSTLLFFVFVEKSSLLTVLFLVPFFYCS